MTIHRGKIRGTADSFLLGYLLLLFLTRGIICGAAVFFRVNLASYEPLFTAIIGNNN